MSLTHREGIRPLAALVASVLLLVGILGAALASAVGTAQPAHAQPPSEITLADTAGIIYEPQLRSEVEQISFYEPTHVVVFTERGTASSNFNERVLAYARQNHPEWISADGQKWADGLLIVGIDPDGRHVGTYFGEDRKLSTGQQENIQSGMGDLLRDAQWTDAAIHGIQEAAGLMNRPWYANPALWIVSGAVALIGGGSVAGVAAHRANQRRKAQSNIELGRASFSSVTMDLEATELNARTVPETTYGAQVLEKYRSFHDRYVALVSEEERISALDPKKLHIAAHLKATEDFKKEAQSLDHLDDVVAHTNTFLNRQQGWEKSWDVQTAPLREDLEKIVNRDGGDKDGLAHDQASRAALTAFRTETEAEIERLGAALQTREITPDDALDRIAQLRTRLTEMLDRHAEAAIDAFATSESERRKMREALESSRRQQDHRHDGSILDTVHAPGHFWTMVAFNNGYASGRSSVESARQAASSSSSTTGYGSSGGSFSGAGSSSRF